MSEIFKDNMNEMPKWHPIEDEFDAFENDYKSPIEMITSDYDNFVEKTERRVK